MHYTEEKKLYILNRIEELKPWYHSIDLGDGIVTPGRKYDHMWNLNLKVMENIEYKDKDVLDIASWDGFWAFNAESRGAKSVVTSDIRLKGFENLLFCKEILKSRVIPLCNCSVNSLNTYLASQGIPKKFDIVQHFGLLYHLRDPLLSLTNCRQVMKENSILLLETAFVDDNNISAMYFTGVKPNFHFYGPSDTWAPTLLCLKEMLMRSCFMPILENAWQCYLPETKQKFKLGRICMIAKAVSEEGIHECDLRKMNFA